MNEPDLAIIQDHLRKSLLDYAASCGARPNWIQEIENIPILVLCQVVTSCYGTPELYRNIDVSVVWTTS